MNDIVPVILSGGSGLRLWPVSRAMYPKQLQALFSKRSMLQEALIRVSGDGFSDPVIICNNDHRFIIGEQVEELGIKPRSILLEPVGRNTAPAAAVAALVLAEQDPATPMLLMPSDHMISDPEAFFAACNKARPAVDSGLLVTFGVTPSSPKTGYGYIHCGNAIDEMDGVFAVDGFVEKPDRKAAEDYLESGGYYWNSGIFMFQAGSYLAELERLLPDMLSACKKAVENASADLDFMRLEEKSFQSIQPNSIDYAVMEHTKNAAMVQVDMGWSDIGSWAALWGVDEKNEEGNVIRGAAVMLDVKNSYIRSTGQVIAGIGLDEMIVVATDDAVLIAPKDRAQDVRDVVELLKESGRTEHEAHTRVYRPWGWYQTIDAGSGFQVKQLMVKPGGVLSLQSHAQRSEHWVVVSGSAKINKGDDVFTLEVNQSTYIPAGVTHRLENTTDEPLRIIEVQSGDYLGEDDIVRLEDIYGRK